MAFSIVQKTFIVFYAIVAFTQKGLSQNSRGSDKNTIGWFNNFTTIKFAKKWSAHVEYQWRRENLIKSWQQSLFRTGINYNAGSKLSFRAGYAWVETFPYGDIPLQEAGIRFPEHRIFEMATITDNIGIADISHRFMLEQRWIGRYTNTTLTKPDDFAFLNRVRYMYRMQIALGKKRLEDKTPYAAFYDEVFIGFGKNVKENVFDQNRLALLLGYRFNKTFRIEGGFLQQIVQLGREANNRNIFQYNNGIILNSYFNIAATQ